MGRLTTEDSSDANDEEEEEEEESKRKASSSTSNLESCRCRRQIGTRARTRPLGW